MKYWWVTNNFPSPTCLCLTYFNNNIYSQPLSGQRGSRVQVHSRCHLLWILRTILLRPSTVQHCECNCQWWSTHRVFTDNTLSFEAPAFIQFPLQLHWIIRPIFCLASGEYELHWPEIYIRKDLIDPSKDKIEEERVVYEASIDLWSMIFDLPFFDVWSHSESARNDVQAVPCLSRVSLQVRLPCEHRGNTIWNSKLNFETGNSWIF